jgi:hypothetical protein
MAKCNAKSGGEGRNAMNIRRGRRKRYEYIKRLTIFLLVIGISGKIGRVKRKGNEAPNTLVGNEKDTI